MRNTKAKFSKIEKELFLQAKELLHELDGKFIIEPQTPQRIIDGAAVMMKHCPAGRILDVGTGQGEVFSVLKRFNNNYDAHICDDFRDPWHSEFKPKFLLDALTELGLIPKRVDNAATKLPYEDQIFDGVLCCDMIEHLHHTPRFLMEEIHRVLKPGGVVVIGMPNSVNFRKRIDVLRGRTNYVDFDQFWNDIDGIEYRGHVREYTPKETFRMIECGNFTPLCIYMLDWQVIHRLSGLLVPLWMFLSFFFPSTKDSYLVVGTKHKQSGK